MKQYTFSMQYKTHFQFISKGRIYIMYIHFCKNEWKQNRCGYEIFGITNTIKNGTIINNNILTFEEGIKLYDEFEKPYMLNSVKIPKNIIKEIEIQNC